LFLLQAFVIFLINVPDIVNECLFHVFDKIKLCQPVRLNETLLRSTYTKVIYLPSYANSVFSPLHLSHRSVISCVDASFQDCSFYHVFCVSRISLYDLSVDFSFRPFLVRFLVLLAFSLGI
jgi:hypothetical protein